MSAPPAKAAVEPRLRARFGDREVVLSPGSPSAELDELLAEHGAETFAFLPLYAPKKNRKKRKHRSFDKWVDKRRERLGEGSWREGNLEAHGSAVPGSPRPLETVSFRRESWARAAMGYGLG